MDVRQSVEGRSYKMTTTRITGHSASPETNVNRMNVGIFVTSLNPKGAAQARFQQALLTGLQKLNSQRYRFIVLSNDVPEGFKDSDNFTYLKIERNRGWTRVAHFLKARIGRSLLFVCELCGLGGGRLVRDITRWMSWEPRYHEQLRELNVRLFWNMNQHELPTRVPFIRTIWDLNHRIHSMYPEFSHTRFTFDGLDRNLAYSLARASYVIVGTEEGKRQVESIYGVYHGKVRVIPFPTPELAANEEYSGDGRQIARGPYIFYPARLWPHKNHVVAIAAMKILKSKWNLIVHCVFSGADEGNLGHVLRYAEALGVKDQVEYVGVVPEKDLVALYKGALALVYASAVGPDNLPPLEAMSLGCPVITAEVPGTREQCGDAALYFLPTSDQQLADRIKEVLENSTVRNRLIDHGRARAASWRVEDYAHEMIVLFDEFALIARAWEKSDSAFT